MDNEALSILNFSSELFIKMFFLFLPAGMANTFASLTKRINFLNIPIDKEIYGENKTYRGFFFGFIGALIFVIGEFYLYQTQEWFVSYSIIRYDNISIFKLLLVSAIFSFGALGGDLIKSYFKRKKKIMPGNPWIPYDQIDWILGTNILLFIFSFDYQISYMVFSYLKTRIEISSWIVILPVSIILAIPIHLLFNRIGYWLKLQENKT